MGRMKNAPHCFLRRILEVPYPCRPGAEGLIDYCNFDTLYVSDDVVNRRGFGAVRENQKRKTKSENIFPSPFFALPLHHLWNL
jgi:hypothetical protein